MLCDVSFLTRLIVIVVGILQATGISLGIAVQSSSSVVTAIIIAFIYSWELALFILGLAPAFILASFLRMKLFQGFASSKELEGAGQVSILLTLYVSGCIVFSSTKGYYEFSFFYCFVTVGLWKNCR